MQGDEIGYPPWTIPNAIVTSQGILAGMHCHPRMQLDLITS